MIQPCRCGKKWHRVCIREYIISNQIKQCPECNFIYSVGFTDCYAVFNKKRKNSLFYMLVNELILFVGIIAFAELIRHQANYAHYGDIYYMTLLWYIIL